MHLHIHNIHIKQNRCRGAERDLVLRIELLLELRDFTLLGGGEVLGVVPAHLCGLLVVVVSARELRVERKVKEFRTCTRGNATKTR